MYTTIPYTSLKKSIFLILMNVAKKGAISNSFVLELCEQHKEGFTSFLIK